METDIFKPYKVLEHTDKKLNLTEPVPRKIFLFIFFRVYPVVMVSGLITTILAFDFPIYQSGLLALIILFFIWVLTLNNFVEEVNISNREITIGSQTFFGRSSKTYYLDEIEKITVVTYLIILNGGYYFRLKLKKPGRQVLLISIPSWFTNAGKREIISKILESVTGLKVVKW